MPLYDDSYKTEQMLRRVDNVQVLLFMHSGTFAAMHCYSVAGMDIPAQYSAGATNFSRVEQSENLSVPHFSDIFFLKGVADIQQKKI